jgi:hypothetical protein
MGESKVAGGSKEREKAGADFLRADFDESFQQMRHYDSQIFDVCKFAFLGYSSVLGVGIGLYEVGFRKNLNLVFPIVAIVSVGLIVGVMVLGLIIRNRVYFVVNTRYIKELRAHFLASKPLGFQNNSAMYTDWLLPPYFDVWSSHLLVSYVIAFLNTALVGFLLYVTAFADDSMGTVSMVLITVGLLFLQITASASYLKSRERASAKDAKHRQDKEDDEDDDRETE